MITGGQKQTSVWDANNTRAEGGEEVGGGGGDDGMAAGEGGLGWVWRDGWYS